MLNRNNRWDEVLTQLAAWCCLLLLSAAQAQTPAGENTQKPLTVGFAQDTLANDWRKAQVESVQLGLSRYPHIRFIYTDARGSTAKQIQDIEDLIFGGVDILITSPRDAHAMTPVIEQAYQRGIPVILLTRRIDSEAFTTLIAPDDEAIARDAASYLAENLGGEGDVLMLQGVPSASTAMARTNAFIDELGKHPGVRLSAIKSANYLRSDAIKAVEEVMQQGIHFDAIYAQSDSMASGARIALSKAGIDPGSLLIVGIDYISEARQAIRRGQQSASFTYPICADEAVNAVLTISSGKPLPKVIHVPSKRITRDNVEQIEPIF
jgi:ribose transport system substrate-binding protein